jgi:4-diphosphocytidyl-2-C-methyl-D-erythritol kinase
MIVAPVTDAYFETGFAKINLALHVRARRADGYHELDTIFAFVDDGDHLFAEIAGELTLDISGPFASDLCAGADNLVLQAAHVLQAHFKIEQGAKLTLIKRLPIASGIGGGSADAAAAARLLNRLWRIYAPEEALAALLAPLGADIPACVFSSTQIGRGIGTSLSPIKDEGLYASNILLVNPNIALSTGPVFRAWDGQDRGGLSGNTLSEMVFSGRNDLQAPANSQCPEIAEILQALQHHDPLLAQMSGSGATCFALFSTKNKCLEAQANIKNAYPHWWTMVGKLR